MEKFYGIELAELSGLDASIVEDAKRIALQLTSAGGTTGNHHQRGPHHPPATSDTTITSSCAEPEPEQADGDNVKYRLAARLVHLLTNELATLNIDLINSLQNELLNTASLPNGDTDDDDEDDESISRGPSISIAHQQQQAERPSPRASQSQTSGTDFL